MLDRLWVALALPFFLGLAASWLIEALLQPRPRPPWCRPLTANLTHAGVWLMAFALEVALFQRPYFAVANVLAIELVLVVVSLAKYRSLQEPFVYPDFEYFLDAMRHPRLYLPFLGWGSLIGLCGGYGLALWAGLEFESSLVSGIPSAMLYPTLVLLALAGLALAIAAGRGLDVDFDAEGDLRRLGLVSALWAYGRAERQSMGHMLAQSPFRAVPRELPAELPDLVSIQSESFFDVRRAYPIVKKEVLDGFDTLCREALVHGELEVAARGANTVRTEFAFLSGLSAEALGVHRYNPYRRLARRENVPTLVSYLRQLGYRTICVHPYHGEFYRRREVLPALGFDEFIDLQAFEQAEKAGAYVGDRALGRFVSDLLRREGSQPLYLHVITMENHGPLHWESVTQGDVQEQLEGPLPHGCEDLVAYARHLRNADAMFSDLRQTLLENGRPAGLCVFGDHVPIMPRVYATLGEVSGTTDGLIWSTNPSGGARAVRRVSDFGIEWLARFSLLSR